MILTNEITIPVKHTESPDINEEYLKSFYELTVSTEPTLSSSSSPPLPSSSVWSPSSDYGGAYTIEIDTTYPSSNSPNVITV